MNACIMYKKCSRRLPWTHILSVHSLMPSAIGLWIASRSWNDDWFPVDHLQLSNYLGSRSAIVDWRSLDWNECYDVDSLTSFLRFFFLDFFPVICARFLLPGKHLKILLTNACNLNDLSKIGEESTEFDEWFNLVSESVQLVLVLILLVAAGAN